ncbi:MAG: beta-N-acetylhexosaminidase [Dissulfurimicrobium sp.]|uniref:beta-N-acetylhexosaminidase n=1 Tax=Dissulfurimicrobium sp. TaxID=2022436 RepID=UPI004049C1C4
MIGQLIMMGIPGPELDAVTRSLIRELGVGNFILFKRNVKDPDQLKKLCDSLKEACLATGLPQPIIAVDQEGGPVQRLGPPYWQEIPSNSDVAGTANPFIDAAYQAKLVASAFKAAGIGLNLAPVLDLAQPDVKGVLAGRSYGPDPEKTGMLGAAYINALQALGIGACAKHFPGIGRIRKDPHLERPVVFASKDILLKDMLPFKIAIDQDVAAIMTSHVTFTALDQQEPATYSSHIAKDILRNMLGFKGVLMTDDLEMGGITGYLSVEEASLKAFLAGHDLLLICHEAERVKRTVAFLDHALNHGVISAKQLDESLERLDRLRKKIAMDARC